MPPSYLTDRSFPAGLPTGLVPVRVIVRVVVLVELLLLGRTSQGGGGGDAAGDDLGHVVEVASADLALVLGSGVAVLLGSELGLLQLGVSSHAPVPVVVGELKHRVVERVEAGKGDKLELIAHLPDLILERRDLLLRELHLPVEGWRAVVRQY